MTLVDAVSPAPAWLPSPGEPVELRETLRTALLDGADWEARFGPELGVGDALWSEWGTALGAAGMSRSQFAAGIRDYRRELWLWLVGDRVWPQAVSGLAGRLHRRSSAGRADRSAESRAAP